MKQQSFFLYFLSALLITVLFLVSASPADNYDNGSSLKDIKKDTKELMESVKSFTFKQKDKALHETKAALEKIDKRIDKFEKRADEKWDEMDKEARKKTRESLKKMQKERNKVSEWYGSMKQSSEKAWYDMKEGFLDTYNKLFKSFQDAREEFSSKE